MLKTKGFIEPKGSKRDFEGGFFGLSSTLIDAHTLPGQKACVCALMRATEGLKVGCIGMGGWVGCGGMGGLQKLITDLDMRYGYKGGV